ncbi:hypothetical protein BgiMline_016802, partial [Biomphalaria glabrata]
ITDVHIPSCYYGSIEIYSATTLLYTICSSSSTERFFVTISNRLRIVVTQRLTGYRGFQGRYSIY